MFCTDLPVPAHSVPCTLVKEGGQLIDLSPLTKTSGGHLVDAFQNRTILINVCRDISGANSDGTDHCPQV